MLLDKPIMSKAKYRVDLSTNWLIGLPLPDTPDDLAQLRFHDKMLINTQIHLHKGARRGFALTTT